MNTEPFFIPSHRINGVKTLVELFDHFGASYCNESKYKVCEHDEVHIYYLESEPDGMILKRDKEPYRHGNIILPREAFDKFWSSRSSGEQYEIDDGI